MKISADPKNPAYSPISLNAKVFLYGVELKNCVTADDEAGEVVCYRMIDGHLIISADGNPETEILRGRVEIKLPQ